MATVHPRTKFLLMSRLKRKRDTYPTIVGTMDRYVTLQALRDAYMAGGNELRMKADMCHSIYERNTLSVSSCLS